MATKKISELTALTTPDGAEELVVNDGGTSKKITIDNTIKSSFPNITTDVTSTTTELNYLDITTLGTQQASKAVTANASNIISSFESTGIDDNATSTAITIDSSENVSVDTGNLVIGTSGKGIDFSATSDGSGTMTSELLDDYEVGTWTPSFIFDVGGAGIVYGTQKGRYTKVGNLVTIIFELGVTSGITASDYYLRFAGIPFNVVGAGQSGGRVLTHNTGSTTFNITASGTGASLLCYATGALNDFARGDDVNGRTISGSLTYRTT